MKTPKLVLLRGNSGSGKTTVAKKLFEAAKKGTVLINQDHYRFIFKPAGGTINSKTIHKMILSDVLLALEDGYDVILEGIFTTKSYGGVFAELIKEHPTQNYFFYLDVSFKETIKRHATRQTKNQFTEKDMRDWYKLHDFTGYDFEHIITEEHSAEQMIAIIREVASI